MSSCRDSGNSADVAAKEKDTPCPEGGKHSWIRRGSWPSNWEECNDCGKRIFWK